MIDTTGLDADQAAAVKAILTSTDPVTILTGKAGTGKSRTIRHLRKITEVTVCAPTGCAALLVNGVTADSLYQFVRRDNEPYGHRNLDQQERNMRASADVIIIDEAPMIGQNMADYIYNVSMRAGKRLLLVGDWAQTSPVKDDWITRSVMWAAGCPPIHRLEVIHRQTDKLYLEALNQIRHGNGDDPQARAVFQSRIVPGPPPCDEYVRLYATNRDVDEYNALRLRRFSDCFQFNSIALDAREKKDRPLPDNMFDNAIKDSPFPSGVASWFAIGCRVVVTANSPAGDDGLAYVNGDAGVIESVEWMKAKNRHGEAVDFPKRAAVRLDRTGDTVYVCSICRAVVDVKERPLIQVYGIPLRLGYAITIHKAQGMTVHKAYVNIESICRHPAGQRHGLAYVALSRTQTREGLQISSWDPRAVECAAAVRDLI